MDVHFIGSLTVLAVGVGFFIWAIRMLRLGPGSAATPDRLVVRSALPLGLRSDSVGHEQESVHSACQSRRKRSSYCPDSA